MPEGSDAHALASVKDGRRKKAEAHIASARLPFLRRIDGLSHARCASVNLASEALAAEPRIGEHHAMSLFSKDPPAAALQQQPVVMSEHAKARLHALRGDDNRGRLFTSDLSVSEFALVKKAGFDPLGLVVGSSIYHVGYQATTWAVSQEMTVLSQAMYQARELAMTRLEEEAAALGADGVVGVRLDINRYEFGENLAEFVAFGTAVKAMDGQSYLTKQGKPFTSDLSGQDFAVLRGLGYAPAGLVMGSCVYHVAHQSMRQAWRTMGTNTEMTAFTQALYDAREIAMERMQLEAKDLGAEGVVGVTVAEKNYGWESHVIEYLAIGTAIVPRPAVAVGATVVLDIAGR